MSARTEHWIVPIAATAVTVVAGVIIFIAHDWYSTVYAGLGVEPEEVGLGRADFLVRVGPVVVGLAALALVALVILFRAVDWVDAIPRTGSRGKRFLLGAVRLLLAFGLFVAFVGVIDLATHWYKGMERDAATQVIQGHILDGGSYYLYAISAHCVTLVSLDPTRSDQRYPPGPLLYLGRSDGVGVFYRAVGRRTYRLPLAGFELVSAHARNGLCL